MAMILPDDVASGAAASVGASGVKIAKVQTKLVFDATGDATPQRAWYPYLLHYLRPPADIGHQDVDDPTAR